MSDPLVSVVVPAYNYGRFLPEALASILAQEDAPPFEVVVVDDASTDDTAQVLAAVADPRVRVLRHGENRGHLRTVETGLQACRGAYIARLDADDRYRPSFLRLAAAALDAHPDVGLVYGNIRLIDASGAVTGTAPHPVHGRRPHRGNEFLTILAENTVPVPGMMARRQCWLQLLPIPDDQHTDDWYFSLNMARRWDTLFLPDTVADYRVHGANHHAMAARTGRDERSVRALLERVYGETEEDPALEAAKRRARGPILAGHLSRIGDRYFGFGDFANARRCYLEAVRHDPRHLRRGAFLRHLAGTLLGRRLYGAAKGVLGRGGDGSG